MVSWRKLLWSASDHEATYQRLWLNDQVNLRAQYLFRSTLTLRDISRSQYFVVVVVVVVVLPSYTVKLIRVSSLSSSLQNRVMFTKMARQISVQISSLASVRMDLNVAAIIARYLTSGSVRIKQRSGRVLLKWTTKTWNVFIAILVKTTKSNCRYWSEWYIFLCEPWSQSRFCKIHLNFHI